MGSMPSFNVIAVGIGAGVASALGFIAPSTGTALAIPLFMLSPLTAVIASLGWGTSAGVVAVVADAAVVAAYASPTAALLHVLMAPLPAVVLSHVLGLARSADPARPDAARLWFPLGAVLTVATIVVGLTTMLSGLLAGVNDTELLHDLARGMLMGANGPEPEPAQIEAMVRFIIAVMPVASPAIWFLVTIANLYLGARVARMSDRLARPWEPLDAATPPRAAAGATVGLGVLTAIDGPIGWIAAPFFGTTLALMLLMGLAVLHRFTRGNPLRPVWLAAIWASLILTLPAVILTVIGLLDTLLRWRERRPVAP
jgi:hypothetical protein